MLIVSKYRDYYDSAVGMGIDKTIVYERHPKSIKNFNELTKKLNNIHIKRNFPYFDDGNYDIDFFIIGFCGKLHAGILLKKYVKYKENIEIIYNFDEIKWESFFKKKSQYRDWIGSFNEFKEVIKNIDPINWFRQFNCPIFIYHPPQINFWYDNYDLEYTRNMFVINPILKDFEFVKVFDPYTAFQEIQMFISGVLGIKEIPTVGISEKDKIIQHGFNKWSFRREPSD